MNTPHHFAILAPVPLEHLESGLEVQSHEPFVAYGTRKWELFQQVDALREGRRVPMLLYPSHEDTQAKATFIVSWFGWYIGQEYSKGGAHSQGMKYRPESTAKYSNDNRGYWASFWHVAGLRELPSDKRLPIGKIQGFKGGWRKTAPPRGPELVTLPELLSYES